MSQHNPNHPGPPSPVDGPGAASKDAGASVVYVRPKDVHLTLRVETTTSRGRRMIQEIQGLEGFVASGNYSH